MADHINALVVHEMDETFHELARTLEALGIRVIYASSFKQAAHLLKEHRAIDLVFAGTDLQDGGWADVLMLTQNERAGTPLILVSRTVDVRLYLDALGMGVFDYVSPPFLTSDFAHIVRVAVYRDLVSVEQDWTARSAA